MTDEEDRLRRLHAALRDIHWSAEALATATGMRPDSARRVVRGCQCRLNNPQKCRLKIPHIVAVQSRP